jgi:hypothetical protein
LRAIHKKPGGKKALHAATTKLAEGKITMADYMSKAERIAKAGAKEAK